VRVPAAVLAFAPRAARAPAQLARVPARVWTSPLALALLGLSRSRLISSRQVFLEGSQDAGIANHLWSLSNSGVSVRQRASLSSGCAKSNALFTFTASSRSSLNDVGALTPSFS